MNVIAITQKGPTKSENEDRIIIGKSIIASGTFQTKESVPLIAVADGVGGNNAGAVASHYVATKLTEIDYLSEKTFAKINENLISLSTETTNYNNMATTLSGLYIEDNCVKLFNVGNTRVYLLQSGKYLKQLTKDDTTLNYLLSTVQLSTEEAEHFEHKNEITACFGGGNIDLLKIKINTIDALTTPFMITSDGVHDYISVDQMEDIIAEYGLSIDTCKKLLLTARSKGSHDDISIILGEL